MKIAVYTIALNESQFIERWAESCKEADYRLIVDTGSSDDTLKLAEEFGCATASITVRPWRFDVARNAALALLPADIDYCISLDADEILMPGWREAFNFLDPKVTRPRYKYVWSSNQDGSERLTFGGDKIHARHGYRWTHPVHEIIVPIGEEVQGWVDIDMRHYPDSTKSRGQYLPLLELAVKESPNDDRSLFYLGREYIFHNRGQEAIPHLLKHLELSKWAPERAACMRYLGKITGNKEHWFLRACAEAPERREPWSDLSYFYYEMQNWPAAYFASLKALSIKEKPLEYLCEPEAWGSLPHDLAGVAAWNMGLKNEGIFHTQNALKHDKSELRIKNNLAMMYKTVRSTGVCAIIPSKSNIKGLLKVVDLLIKETSVNKINIVADGDDAYKLICDSIKNQYINNINIIKSNLGDGIHVMWNLGIESGYHNLFINDDVIFDEGSIDILSGMLDHHSEIGIICPNYDKRIIDIYQSVFHACPGNYDGTDGLAGFCMMLAANLSSQWKFDERMKWYYGDNDVINWVISQNRIAAISGIATMELNPSWTKTNDPPKNFDTLVAQDKVIYENKWNNKKKMTNQYPIFIICRDRYQCTLDLINWLEKTGQENIYLIDNDSRYEPLLEYYRVTPHTVIRTGFNFGHHVPWTFGSIERFSKDKHFIVTDPDILPIEECPLDAIDFFRYCLDKYENKTKAGFGLKIDDIPDHYIHKQKVLDHEAEFWTGYSPEPNVIFSYIDTTFALYKPGATVDIFNSIRTTGNYLARHTPWYIDLDNMAMDEIFYRKRLSISFNNWNH